MKKLQWDKVTKVSQILAIILFVGVFYWGFYLGNQVGLMKVLGPEATSARFVCDNNKSINAIFYKRAVRVSLNKGEEEFLLQTISASGARYANADESLVFWNKGDEALIMHNNEMDPNYTNCTTSKANKII